jgi:hypothetical protein
VRKALIIPLTQLMPTSRKNGYRTSTTGTHLGYEATFWATADKLRGNLDAAEYKHVVLGLMMERLERYVGAGRFPPDFAFQLTVEDLAGIRSQPMIASIRSQIVITSKRNIRYRPLHVPSADSAKLQQTIKANRRRLSYA